MRERHDERAGVEGRGADGGEVGGATFVEILRAAQHVKEVGVVGPEGGREHAAPRVDTVLGGDDLAIAPARVGPKVERVRKTVGGDFPALGEGWFRGERDRLEGNERLEERSDDLGVAEPGDGVRIEVRRFGAHADVKHAGAVADRDR